MNTVFERYKSFIYKLILLIGIFLFIYLTVTFLLPFLAPFVIAVIIAMINEPVIKFLESKIRLPRKLAAVISLLLTLSIFTILIVSGIAKIYDELVVLQKNITKYMNDTSDQLTAYVDKLSRYYHNLPVEITDAVESNLKSLAPKLEGIITSLATYIKDAITSIPKIVVFLIVTLLSTYFISSERKEIRDFFIRQMPDSWSKNLSGIKSDTFTAMIGYFKAVLILIAFTFVEVTVGLAILRVDFALVMGVVVAISDAIPIVGTGLVMVPWILWNLIIGDTHMVFGLLIIYILGVILRQLMEPKILGDQIGLHPLVTLVAMYIGLEVFGILGMIIGPVSIIILKNLQRSGAIKIWND